jgi:hypothetical protein
LEYLCHDCHSEEHNAKNFYIKFDSDGQPIPP